MKRLVVAAVAIVLLISCGGSVERVEQEVPAITADAQQFDVGTLRRVVRFHDDERGATCWVYWEGGISCIPDSQLKGASDGR